MTAITTSSAPSATLLATVLGVVVMRIESASGVTWTIFSQRCFLSILALEVCESVSGIFAMIDLIRQ